MPLEVRVDGAQPQQLPGGKCARFRPGGIEQQRGMTFRQNEHVAAGPMRLLPIEAHYRVEENGNEIRCGTNAVDAKPNCLVAQDLQRRPVRSLRCGHDSSEATSERPLCARHMKGAAGRPESSPNNKDDNPINKKVRGGIESQLPDP